MILADQYLTESIRTCRGQNGRKLLTSQKKVRKIYLKLIMLSFTHIGKNTCIWLFFFLKFLTSQTIYLTIFDFFFLFSLYWFPVELSPYLINLCRYMEHKCPLSEDKSHTTSLVPCPKHCGWGEGLGGRKERRWKELKNVSERKVRNIREKLHFQTAN